MTTGTALVLGATGYVGGRLVPELVRTGCQVRCLTRSPGALTAVPWASDVEVVQGDLFDPQSLDGAFRDVDTVVYLVHSLDGADFERREQECASNTRAAAERAGVQRIVYLGGLGSADDELSTHLRSRQAVGRELAGGAIPVIELRAAVILGAGSASFEMLRSLVEVLPGMIAPRWVTGTCVQPVAIADVLTYLVAAVFAPSGERHRIVEIGGPDALTYRDLMHLYAEVAGLRRRVIVPVPVLTPRLSSHWVNLVTPLPHTLATSLIDSLKNDVVVTDESARSLSPHAPMSARDAIESAISAIGDLDIPTRWSGVSDREQAARPVPWDPEWSGGTVYADCREAHTAVPPAEFQRVVRGIGGERGWYGFGPLWAIRGALDQLVGGVGLRRGRRHPDDIAVGEALDFWRVDALEPQLFRLRAEMRLPGEAWLEWSTRVDDSSTLVVQRARFVPRGIWGRIYWWGLVPFHVLIFPLMLRRIVAAAEDETRTAA